MTMYTDPRSATMGRSAAAEAVDQGLRSYMLKVYNYMASALAVTGLVAWVVAHTPALLNMLYTVTPRGVQPSMLGYVVMFAPLGLVFFLGMKIQTMPVRTAQTVFWVYAGLVGASLAYIFLLYTGASITRVFFITGAAFAGLSLYGYTTKRNLTGMGSFLIMGLIGGLVAMVVNMFLHSTALDLALSAMFLLIFAGLTAYDTQKIKSMYFMAGHDAAIAEKTAIMGALSLYLDFINMFLIMLRFMGNRNQ
ncbi:Bax inhibitor-1/YccA family protein [Oleispirillum naphthae]|uniref:Bax inhibitor-1/YccA family protein n=1 Tax=Oleispirillum naphthae TaxID=2838853 RepID=UPI00308252B5